MLKPYEKSLRNYSSAKLELLALKWAVCDKFKDYLISSKFTVLTDNNPLTYHMHFLLRALLRYVGCQISHCLTLRSNTGPGKSNQVANALSWQPVNPNSSSESS